MAVVTNTLVHYKNQDKGIDLDKIVFIDDDGNASNIKGDNVPVTSHVHNDHAALNMIGLDSNGNMMADGAYMMFLVQKNGRNEIANYVPSSPFEMIFDTGSSRYAIYDYQVKKWKYIGSKGYQYINETGKGNGLPGTFVQDWEDPENIIGICEPIVYIGNEKRKGWGDAYDGKRGGLWNRHSDTTPSWGTGRQEAKNGKWYIYTEMSGSDDDGNTNYKKDLRLYYDNFCNLDSISFYYNYYGDGTGVFEVIAVASNGVESVLFSDSTGSQLDWKFIEINTAGKDIEKFYFRNSGCTTSYSDLCLDVITINSSE